METESEIKTENKVKLLDLESSSQTERGIIYFSRIPPYMNVKKIRQIFSEYGETDRIFLQPDEKVSEKKKNRLFSEGWLEFVDKKIAKRVARSLNNAQIGGKRRSRWYDEMWNIKYLPKFKWGHLNERLAYERAVHKQRLRAEVAQAKKETNFYIQNVQKKKTLHKLEKKKVESSEDTSRTWSFKQSEPEAVILEKKRKLDSTTSSSETPERNRRKKQKIQDSTDARKASTDKSFLSNIFSGGMTKSAD